MSNISTAEALVEPTVTSESGRIPELINERCDACGDQAVTANHVAYKSDSSLFFCTHHTRGLRDKLVSQGFAIFPDNVDF